jgi:hypothetical protein
MPELDRFDARLEHTFHAFADAAHTRVDAAATAERAIRRGRAGRVSWLGYAVPVPVSILIVLALLLLAVVVSLGIGSPRRQQGMVPPVAIASVTPAPPASPASLPPAPIPSPDGEGDESVAGTESLALPADWADTATGDTARLRDAVITTSTSMDDPRVRGTGTWRVNADLRSGTGPVWGAYRLAGPAGTWEGTCTGSLWAGGAGGARNCLLAGSGDYDGYTCYLSVTWSDLGGDVRGVIYPGLPPAP